jgi:hypothetical protein
MTRPTIRPLPLLVLVLAIGCNSTPEAPPAPRAEPAPAADTATATEAPVPPAPGGDAPAMTSGPAVQDAPTADPGPAAAETPPAETRPAEAPRPRPAPAPVRPAPAAPAPVRVRVVTVPAATALRLTLLSDVASDTSVIEDRVSARVASDVMVDGETVIPAGSRVAGVVTFARPSGKVKGRASITVRFRTITIGSRTYDMAAAPLRREARGTKARDAGKIGIGAGAGAIVGGIIGGGRGAGIGAAVGGAGGTGVVLATAGDEVRLSSGTAVSTTLEAPLAVDVRTGQ